VTENLTGLHNPANAFDSKERQTYITVSDINTFLVSLSKQVEGDIHTGLPGGVGAESATTILTDGMEDITEQINRMEPVDSTLVCTSHSHLKEYKSCFGDLK